MNITQPFAEIWLQPTNDNLLINMFKHIERVGRVCYRSEDKTTSDSYKRFIKMLEDSNHGAMLEHGTVYLTINKGSIDDDSYANREYLIEFFLKNKFSKVNIIHTSTDIIYYITTNYRVIIENKLKEHDVMNYMYSPTEYHEKRYTVHFSTDIGVTREANRHRTNSIAESSTRYCNYAKDKFGHELNINQSAWISDDMISESRNPSELINDFYNIKDNEIGDNDWNCVEWWLFANKIAERAYLELSKKGWKAQQARTILPLDTHSDLIHTAFESDWQHFIDLRSNGTTGAPHPDIKVVADQLKKEFNDLKQIYEKH